jgi:hypothetical protein
VLAAEVSVRILFSSLILLENNWQPWLFCRILMTGIAKNESLFGSGQFAFIADVHDKRIPILPGGSIELRVMLKHFFS